MNAQSFSFDDESESSGDALESAADAIMDQTPEIQEHVVNASQIEESSVENPRDITGAEWDPMVHSSTKKLTAKGEWKKRRNTAAGSALGRPKKASAVADEPAVESSISDEQKARVAGVAAANSFIMLGQILGGPEWNPISGTVEAPRQEKIDERRMLSDAFGDYFAAKGIHDFPPGLALSMALTVYCAPRFAAPDTQARAGRARTWLTLRVAKYRVNRELKKAGKSERATIKNGELYINGTQLDSWNDRVRKDDTSTQTGGTVQSSRVLHPRA